MTEEAKRFKKALSKLVRLSLTVETLPLESVAEATTQLEVAVRALSQEDITSSTQDSEELDKVLALIRATEAAGTREDFMTTFNLLYPDKPDSED